MYVVIFIIEINFAILYNKIMAVMHKAAVKRRLVCVMQALSVAAKADMRGKNYEGTENIYQKMSCCCCVGSHVGICLRCQYRQRYI